MEGDETRMSPKNSARVVSSEFEEEKKNGLWNASLSSHRNNSGKDMEWLPREEAMDAHLERNDIETMRKEKLKVTLEQLREGTHQIQKEEL